MQVQICLNIRRCLNMEIWAIKPAEVIVPPTYSTKYKVQPSCCEWNPKRWTSRWCSSIVAPLPSNLNYLSLKYNDISSFVLITSQWPLKLAIVVVIIILDVEIRQNVILSDGSRVLAHVASSDDQPRQTKAHWRHCNMYDIRHTSYLILRRDSPATISMLSTSYRIEQLV